MKVAITPDLFYRETALGVLFLLSCWILVYLFLYRDYFVPGIPVVGVDKNNWFRIEKARAQYAQRGNALVKEGLKRFKGPFQVITATGPKVFFPSRYAELMKNIAPLSAVEANRKEYFGGILYPEFAASFRVVSHPSQIIQDVIRTNLTRSLNLITTDLSEEASLACQDYLGEDREWHAITLRPIVAHLVARLSSRIFVGTELCRNDEWLQLVEAYTYIHFSAMRDLRQYSFTLQPLVHWFLPSCRRVFGARARAQELLRPLVTTRVQRSRAAAANGEKPATCKTEDTVGWMHELAMRKREQGQWVDDFDFVDAQLSLSTAAIHTVAELLTGILLDLAANAQFIDELRKEMIDVLGRDGTERVEWEKSSLYKMKLLDSALKESQRTHTRDAGTMRRLAEKTVTLADGTVIPKGTVTIVAQDAHSDPSLYPDPDVYDPYRFLKLRSQPGDENKWQLVTTSSMHLGFGHGMRACPGRFFASNEAKIALVHLLLKYDWQLPGGQGRPDDLLLGSGKKGVDGKAQVFIRRRQEEIVL